MPFGTTADVSPQNTELSTITITSPPPGASSPRQAEADAIPVPQPISVSAPQGDDASLDETRASVRRSTLSPWRLVLPDARQIEIAGAVLVGRDPSAMPAWSGAALLTVDDAAHSVSKTHAVFEVDADGLWVMDLDSTNGVVIIQPDGTELDLEPNARARVLPGADVELGDLVVQVERG